MTVGGLVSVPNATDAGVNLENALCDAIRECNVIRFGRNLKNKSDSPSCLFNPRRLLSSAWLLNAVGKEFAQIVAGDGEVSAIVGMGTSGIPWAASCAIHASKPLSYVRLRKRRFEESVEGGVAEGARVVLIDDLIFHGKTLSQGVDILKRYGVEVARVLVLIDRQLERTCDGNGLAIRHQVPMTAIVTMQRIVDSLLAAGAISEGQLAALVSDYLAFDRIRMPEFALRSRRATA